MKAWIVTLSLLLLTGCTATTAAASTGQIFLYGEEHGRADHLAVQLERWTYYYEEHGLRHLFVELPFFTAAFLNVWMGEPDDRILDEIMVATEGTAGNTPYMRQFLGDIKANLPETIFHGTDVGHQFHTTGRRFIEYLYEHELTTYPDGTPSFIYQHTLENIRQGADFHEHFMIHRDHQIRVDYKFDNFVLLFDRLEGESIMGGLYGLLHVRLEDYPPTFAHGHSLGRRLLAHYGSDQVHTFNVFDFVTLPDLAGEPVTLLIDSGRHAAVYLGTEDLRPHFPGRFNARSFYRLTDAYELFRHEPFTGDVLPFDNFPFLVTEGQVFMIHYENADGSEWFWYGRASGGELNGRPTVQEFEIGDRQTIIVMER